MKKSYNLILNSYNGLNQQTIETLTSSVTYDVQWDRFLSEGRFKLTWSYISSGNTLRNREIAYINVLGLILDSNKEVSSTSDGAKTSLCLGIVKNNIIQQSGTSLNVGSLNADLDDNPAIYLNSRPANGPLTINILDQYGNPFLDDSIRFGNTLGFANRGTDTTLVGMRDVSARFILGYPLVRSSDGLTFSKVLDFIDPASGGGFGEPTGGGTIYYYRSINSANTGASNINIRSNGGNPPANYILTLNFELL